MKENPFKNELFMALSTDDTNEIIARLRSVLDQLAPDERNVFIVPVLITQICDNEGCVIVNGNSQIGDGNIQCKERNMREYITRIAELAYENEQLRAKFNEALELLKVFARDNEAQEERLRAKIKRLKAKIKRMRSC